MSFDRNALEALRAARKAGVIVVVAADGEHLMLKARAEPPRVVLDALSRHKPAIIADLRRARALIKTFAQWGVALGLDGSDIVHRGPRGVVSPALLENLKANKLAIIAELQRQRLQRQAPAAKVTTNVAPP
jgi:hypothetical protein